VDEYQRPGHMVPGLTSKPWHDPEDFPWVRRLEDGWRRIRAELDAVLEGRRCEEAGLGRGPRGGAAWPRVHGDDQALAEGTGVWREFPVLGLRGDTETRCPFTHALLSDIEAVRSHRDLRSNEETAVFSRLTPGTHLRAHCGPTNTHLTCHLGLRVPGGCSLRVGGETRSWEEGRCVVFDDSFEHEVWHQGDTARVVLLIRFWHPDIPAARRRVVLQDDVRDRRLKAWWWW